MTDQLIGAHNDLHSEHGARAGEHPGRSANPIVKVHNVLWLEFEEPDLVKAEAFLHSFGFATALRTKDKLHLRGSDTSAPLCADPPWRAREVSGAGVCRSGAVRSGAAGRRVPGLPCARCRRRWAG